LTEEKFNKLHPNLKEFITQSAQEKNLITVVIRVEKRVVQFINEQKYYHGFVSEQEKDGYMELTFLTESIEGFARWFMMFGDMAEIVICDALKQRVGELAGKLSKNNS
jgi:predicted DNA-binding transcriptional regulator YafY